MVDPPVVVGVGSLGLGNLFVETDAQAHAGVEVAFDDLWLRLSGCVYNRRVLRETGLGLADAEECLEVVDWVRPVVAVDDGRAGLLEERRE